MGCGSRVHELEAARQVHAGGGCACRITSVVAAMDLVALGIAMIVEAEFGLGLAQQELLLEPAACLPQDLRAGKSTSTIWGLRRAGTIHHVGSCDLEFRGAHISLAVVVLTKDDFAGLLLTCSHTKSEQEVSKYKAWSMTRCKPGATKSNTRLGRVKQSFARASCQAGSACPKDKISRPWHAVRQLGPARETFTRYFSDEQWRFRGFS
jgi:hypothetical protein